MSDAQTIEAPTGFYLIDCTGTIIRAIANGITQKEIAFDYGMAIRSEAASMDQPDWKSINSAILNRWSMSGLQRIKKQAWKISGVNLI